MAGGNGPTTAKSEIRIRAVMVSLPDVFTGSDIDIVRVRSSVPTLLYWLVGNVKGTLHGRSPSHDLAMELACIVTLSTP